jgi:uncharacterized Zn finger protein
MAPPQFTRAAPAQARFGSSPAPRAPLVNPKKVRNGVKLPSGEPAPAGAWAAQRWLRLIEQMAEGNAMADGLEYAHAGQTKKFTVSAGKIEGIVQGRADKPYTSTIAMDVITHEQWEKAVQAMSEGAIYAAKLLAAELPPSIEDVFVPMGLKLFPHAGEGRTCDLRVSCTCGHFSKARREGETAGWCKHVCCVAVLLVHRLAGEPFLVFALRGMETHDLLDRLRQRRQVVGAALGATPIYPQRVPGVSDVESASLEQSLGNFWQLGPEAQTLDLAPQPPAVTHPLLRRLGQSPWTGTGHASFPLVGLLASCYDTISQHAAPESAGGEAPSASNEGDEGDD